MRAQADYPADLVEMESWVRGAAMPGARVLELGCGDGALVRRLAPDFDVLGVDPAAEPSDRIRAVEFETLDEAPFDVVFASVSLHHLADPTAAADALRRLTRPGTAVLVREFDRVAMDHEPTLRWWFDRYEPAAAGFAHAQRYSDSHHHGHHGHQRDDDHDRGAGDGHEMNTDDDGHELPVTFDAFVPWWREAMQHHVLPWADVQAMLAAAGVVAVDQRDTPWLFRWLLGERHRPAEEAAIAAGAIRAVGRRWTGHRR